MIVVDASAAVEMLLGTTAGRRCAEHAKGRAPAVVPAHFDVEVYAALRRSYLRRAFDRRTLDSLVGRLIAFDAERSQLRQFLQAASRLADVVGAHDAFYLLLSAARGCPLLTCDLRLARAGARLGVEVIAIDRSRNS